ncbi:MAG: response regulator [Bradyrhizobium sp.]|uniref:response regulator n=1 Tax=Bradyrhizobium sp. TaxID=376 RepID=UPI0025B87CF2|nr:response regulator [Bradyrhizobium sp.]MBI5263977.1 response regulator [Bradyrhizobium sp.]
MWEKIRLFFDTSAFSPHGICLLWEPELLTVHVVSDAVIALSYFSIPFALAYFVYRRRDVEFGWIFWAFALFIMACGFTHAFAIYTLWIPAYGLEGVIKAATAIASVLTAVLIWPLIPKVLALPSPGQLRLAHAMLEAESRQRRETEALFSHTQKMETIGQLTGGIAHDFNNLLMVISGNLEIADRALARGSEASYDRIRKAIESARQGSQRAATLTQRLLAFARKQPFDTKVINVNQVVASIEEFIVRTVGESIKMEMAPDATLWNTETDPHQLEAALLNLIVNARDAMPSGGQLTIETANVYVDRQFAGQHLDLTPGPYVVISVTDTGMGMDQPTVEHAFEPFFSTKSIGQGTGLGLSQVYGFAKQSGGVATIGSVLGKGTCVSIYLPRTELPLDAQPAFLETAHIEIGNGETILVAEDDNDVRNYIVETLNELGYTVLEACDAEQAVEMFEAHRGAIDLLLTDVIMPGKNGRILSDELRRSNEKLRVIFMTGYSRDVITHDGRLERGLELLQKPVTQKGLADKLKAILGKKTEGS